MKKIWMLIVIATLIAALPITMAACDAFNGEKGETTPTTAKEKIAFAFNGVEKSLTNQQAYLGGAGKTAAKTSSWFAEETAYADSYDNTQELAEIYAMFDVSERTDNPNFKYDEPPMIQFQYIKALYQEMGDSYELGKTYESTFTGTILYDFATGEKTLAQNYTCNAKIDLTLDPTDRIIVHMGLRNTYEHEGEVHEQRFYAELYLNYDMTKTSPNYELTIKYVDDCSRYELEAERTNTYEYDYVKVIDSKIAEWRKFYYCSPIKMVKDADHATFASYLDSDAFAGRARAYKNGIKYFTNHTDRHDNDDNAALRRQLCAALFEKFGLNATDIRSDDYLATQGEQSASIKATFDQFSRIAGEDIIGSLVTSGAADSSHQDDGEGGGQGGLGSGLTGVANWPAETLNAYFGMNLPVLQTAQGSVQGVQGDGSNGYLLTLIDVTNEELDGYGFDLKTAGFRFDGEAFLMIVDDTVYAVAFEESYNAILFAKRSKSDPSVTPGTEDPKPGTEDPKPGTEDPKPGSDDPQPSEPTYVTVTFVVINAFGNEENRWSQQYIADQLVELEYDVAQYKLAYDSTGRESVGTNVYAYDGLQLYLVPIRNQNQEQVRLNVYDVDEEGNLSLYTSVPNDYGTTVGYGYYEYVLFADKDCTQPIDPDFTEQLYQDKDVYRRDFYQEVYVYVPVRYFICGVEVTGDARYASNDFQKIRRGKIYSESNFGVYPFLKDWGGAYYYDQEKGTPLFETEESKIYFDETNVPRLYAFSEHEMFCVVEYYHNNELIVKDVTGVGDYIGEWSLDTQGYHISELGDVYVAENGGRVELVKYERLVKITYCYCSNGVVVGHSYGYVTKDGEYEITEAMNHYTDASCTTPLIRKGVLTSDLTVYLSLDPRD